MEINLAQQTPLITTRQQENLRLGVIGCGYVTAMSHLPALRMAQGIELAALVDVRLDLARTLAEQYPARLVTADYRDLYSQVDAVVVALPHPLHAQVALDFLERGIHVLVEKPMAMSVAECQQMIRAAQSSGAKLAVGLMRRFYESSRFVKRMIDTNFLGAVQRFEAQEAVLFDRFKASAFTVLPPAGGVLFDTGPHTLDLLLWWLGDFASLRYWDDARGGVEANCRIEIITAQGAPGCVELSRTRRIENKIEIICEQGSIVFPTQAPDQAALHSPLYPGGMQLSRMKDEQQEHTLAVYFTRQLENFRAAISGKEALEIPGEEGMRSIAVIEQCKRSRQPLEPLPWEENHLKVMQGLA